MITIPTWAFFALCLFAAPSALFLIAAVGGKLFFKPYEPPKNG